MAVAEGDVVVLRAADRADGEPDARRLDALKQHVAEPPTQKHGKFTALTLTHRVFTQIAPAPVLHSNAVVLVPDRAVVDVYVVA